MAVRTMIFLTRIELFFRFGKDPENTDMLSTQILNLVGKRKSFNDSCRGFTDGAKTFH